MLSSIAKALYLKATKNSNYILNVIYSIIVSIALVSTVHNRIGQITRRATDYNHSLSFSLIANVEKNAFARKDLLTDASLFLVDVVQSIFSSILRSADCMQQPLRPLCRCRYNSMETVIQFATTFQSRQSIMSQPDIRPAR